VWLAKYQDSNTRERSPISLVSWLNVLSTLPIINAATVDDADIEIARVVSSTQATGIARAQKTGNLFLDQVLEIWKKTNEDFYAY